MILRRDFQVVFLLLVVCFGGCSSLPDHPVIVSEAGTRAATFYRLGNKSYQAGRYDKATSYFKQALSLHASVDDGAGVSLALSGLGRVELALGDLDAAEGKFQRGLRATTELQRPDLEAQAMGGLGAVALKRGLPREAMGWIDQALALPLEDPGLERAVLLHDLGVAFERLKDLESADLNFRLALVMHEMLEDDLGIAGDCYSLALLNESLGDFDTALLLAQRALASDKVGENPLGIAQDLTLLGSLALQNGLPELSADYYQRALLAWQAMGRQDKCLEVSLVLETIPLSKH